MDNQPDAPSERRDLRERGAGLVEYVLLLSLIALTCIGALTYFGGTSGNSVVKSSQCIVAADGTAPTGDCSK